MMEPLEPRIVEKGLASDRVVFEIRHALLAGTRTRPLSAVTSRPGLWTRRHWFRVMIKSIVKTYQ
jgi:hypothetical protein